MFLFWGQNFQGINIRCEVTPQIPVDKHLHIFDIITTNDAKQEDRDTVAHKQKLYDLCAVALTNYDGNNLI